MEHMKLNTQGLRKERRAAMAGIGILFAAVAAVIIFCPDAVYASALKDAVSSSKAASSITAPFDTLKDLVATILSSIGTIVTLWGIGEWGISFQGSEGTMQAQAFKRIGGGLVMAMASQILTLLL